MDPHDWIEAFADELGAEAPAKAETDQVLDLAAVAAHSSARLAAPVACWVAGRAGVGIEAALAAAQRVGTSADG